MMIRMLKQVATVACYLSITASCASLPDTQFLSDRYATHAARFEAHGARYRQSTVRPSSPTSSAMLVTPRFWTSRSRLSKTSAAAHS